MRADWSNTLAQRFLSTFPDEVSWRTVGREAEFPIVTEDGSMADIRQLWPLLAEQGDLREHREGELTVALEGADFTFAMEVGLGTVEIISEPRDDLIGLAEIHERAVERLLIASAKAGYRVLGYGIQPLTPASVAMMSPKSRYGVIHDVLGDLWLWFTLTASDQIHVASGRREIAALTDLCNALSGVTIALCGNSSVFAGADSGLCSGREGEMGRIGAAEGRHGMPLRPAGDMAGWIDGMADNPVILRWRGDDRAAANTSLEDLLREHGGPESEAAWRDFLLHDHYLWNSARPRHKQSTLELRAACQQPGSEHMASAALHLGLVAAAHQLQPWLQESLGDDWWVVLSAYHDDAVRLGMAAEEPFDGFLRGVLDRCTAALELRGRGEQKFMDSLYTRLNDGVSPAERVRSAFDSGGIAAVVEHTRLR